MMYDLHKKGPDKDKTSPQIDLSRYDMIPSILLCHSAPIFTTPLQKTRKKKKRIRLLPRDNGGFHNAREPPVCIHSYERLCLSQLPLLRGRCRRFRWQSCRQQCVSCRCTPCVPNWVELHDSPSPFPFAGRTVDFGTLGVLILLVCCILRNSSLLPLVNNNNNSIGYSSGAVKIAALLERSTEQQERHYVTLSKIDALLTGTARQQTFMKYKKRYFYSIT